MRRRGPQLRPAPEPPASARGARRVRGRVPRVARCTDARTRLARLGVRLARERRAPGLRRQRALDACARHGQAPPQEVVDPFKEKTKEAIRLDDARACFRAVARGLRRRLDPLARGRRRLRMRRRRRTGVRERRRTGLARRRAAGLPGPDDTRRERRIGRSGLRRRQRADAHRRLLRLRRRLGAGMRRRILSDARR
jgi:hypothetical protein